MSARRVAAAAAVLLLAACEGSSHANGEVPPPPMAEERRPEIVSQIPHDTTAYTQGLLYAGGTLFESTGQYGESTLRAVDPRTGAVLRRVDVGDAYFAEGLTLHGGRLYQLTWQSNKGFVYDTADFKRVGEFAYDREGWGLASDGTRLMLSDGSYEIRFMDPATFQVTEAIQVRDGGQYVAQLNELEWVRGEIWANVYQTDRIARIDPATGQVKQWLDLSGLLPVGAVRNPQDEVLNGIAFDDATGRLWVTGKHWPTMFEIRVPDLPPASASPSAPAAPDSSAR